MKALKTLIFGVLIGLLLGLWFGVNIGKDKVWYSNPFKERSMMDKVKSTIGEGVEKAGEGIEKIGEEIKGKAKSN